MADDTEPTFRVEVSSRPILVHICARANFLNCSPLRTFFRNMVAKGNHEFSLDFAQCEGMDSTFLGILAGLAIDTQRSEPQGSVTLTGLGERNLELVKIWVCTVSSTLLRTALIRQRKSLMVLKGSLARLRLKRKRRRCLLVLMRIW